MTLIKYLTIVCFNLFVLVYYCRECSISKREPSIIIFNTSLSLQIDEDLQPEKARSLLNQEPDLDKPGNAQFYCLHCARYFINDQALQEHFKTKVHKRRLKALELEPYSIEESERAAGFGSFKQPAKRKIETQKEVVPNKVKKMEEN